VAKHSKEGCASKRAVLPVIIIIINIIIIIVVLHHITAYLVHEAGSSDLVPKANHILASWTRNRVLRH
jgi:hypothetical protein